MPKQGGVFMDKKEIKELSRYADQNLNLIREINRLSEKIDSNQDHSQKTENRRFLITTAIALLSLLASIVAALAAILSLLS